MPDTAAESWLTGQKIDVEIGALFDGVPLYGPWIFSLELRPRFAVPPIYLPSRHPKVSSADSLRVNLSILDEVGRGWVGVQACVFDYCGSPLSSGGAYRPGAFYTGPSDLPTGLINFPISPFASHHYTEPAGYAPQILTLALRSTETKEL